MFLLYLTATSFGKGTYFASDVSFSMDERYSPEDDNGHCYLYYNRVLTGQYTFGNTDMIVPPPRDPNRPLIKYDSTVDDVHYPNFFVIYYDTQAYPEYLVTFTQ